MPKEQLSIDGLISRVESAGSVLGQKATSLSELIDHINERLQKIQGKVAVSVESDDIELTFGRSSNQWGLWLTDSESPNTENGRAPLELARVSISRKARAFPLLLELLSAITTEQSRQIVEIDQAVMLLANDPDSIRDVGKGGK